MAMDLSLHNTASQSVLEQSRLLDLMNSSVIGGQDVNVSKYFHPSETLFPVLDVRQVSNADMTGSSFVLNSIGPSHINTNKLVDLMCSKQVMRWGVAQRVDGMLELQFIAKLTTKPRRAPKIKKPMQLVVVNQLKLVGQTLQGQEVNEKENTPMTRINL